MSKRKLEKRIEALEKIIKESSITLTNPDNYNQKVVMIIENDLFKTKKITYSLDGQEETFETVNLNQ